MAISPTLSVENWSSLWCALDWAYQGPVPEMSRSSIFYGKCFRAWLLDDGDAVLDFAPRHRPDQNSRIRLAIGKWLFIPSGEGFQRFSDDARILSVSFTARWPTGEPLFAPDHPSGVPAVRVPELQVEGRHLARVCGEHPQVPHHEFGHDNLPLRSLCEINSRLFVWLGSFLEAAREAGWSIQLPTELDPRIASALRLVEEWPLCTTLRIPELAERCGLSASQLNRLFRHHHGCTPATLFAERKREYARRQVQAGQMPLKEICYALGFTAPSHFSAWFRKEFGQAPRTMRDSINEL